MAKKKDDPIDNNDELNEQHHDDFNEADDNFGLPDVDYKPLEEQEVVPESDKPDTGTVNIEETEEEHTAMEEVNTTADDDDYHSGYSYHDKTEEVEEPVERKEYVPGSYTPPEEESSNVGKVVFIILLLVLAALAGWYFFVYKPDQDAKKAQIEQQRKEDAERKESARKLAEEKRKQEEADRLAREQAEAEAEAAPKEGSVETMSGRTGRYYAVVASAIDGDLALDYANKLAKDGNEVKIIPPFGNAKFYRVSVDSGDTWAEADNKARELKGQYGDDVWVIKY